jgi:hypothetical protein
MYCVFFRNIKEKDKKLLTGSAFPQGGGIITGHLPCRKKPKAFSKRSYPDGHHGLLRCAAKRTAQRMIHTCDL